MEDLPQQTADEEKTPAQKRQFLRGNFLTDWLWRRNQPLEMKESDAEEDDDETEKKDSKKLKFSERVRRAFQGIFKREVQLDTQPEKAVEEKLEPTQKVETSNTSTKEQEDNISVEQEEYPAKESQNEPSNEALEDGLLPVSDEAIRRYQTSPAPEFRSPTQEELNELINNQSDSVADNTGTNKNVEMAPVSKKEVKDVKDELDTVELKRRRKERRFKNEVRKLKKQAKSTKEEQEIIKKQQSEFRHQLDDQPDNIRKILTYNSPELQKIYLKQQPRTEVLTSIQPEKPPGIEQLRPNRDILPELRKESLKQEFLSTSLAERPEVIQHKIEAAAEQNIAVESLYEHRHEIKDEQQVDQVVVPSAGAPYSVYFSKRLNRYRQPAALATDNIPAAQSPKPVTNDMYTKAAKDGFLAGLIICVLLLILLIIH